MRNSTYKILIVIIALLLMRMTFAASTIYTEDKNAIIVNPNHSQFSIKLVSNPTTGYSWFLREYSSALLTPVSHQFMPSDNKKLIGAPGYELWTFQVKSQAFIVPQQTLIHFVYLRPWETASQIQQAVFMVSSTLS